MVTDPVAFTIGPFAVRWYGILIMLGVLGGAYLAATLTRRKGENPDQLWNMVPFVVFTAILGARLYWVYLSWDQCCAADPLRGALNIRGGGISIHGAIVFGLLAIWLWTRFNRLRFWRWVDIIVPGMALGQAIGRWGNFANQEAFGGPVSWGIPIAPQNRPAAYAEFERFHPTFLYESIYNLFAAVMLSRLALRIDRDRRLRDGDVLWIYLIGYALVRFAIESLRSDSLYLGPFKAAHVASGLALLVGIVGLGLRHIGWRGRPEDEGSPVTAGPTSGEGTVAADAGPLVREGPADGEVVADSRPAHLVGKTVRGPRRGGSTTRGT